MRHSLAFAFALSCLALLPAVVRGDEEPLDAETLVQRLLTTSNAEEAKEIIDDVVDLAPDASDVDGWLRQGPAYASDVRTGWLAETNLCTDGVERNYLLFVPEDYTPEKKYRLVVDMHGGVSRPQQLSHAQLDQMKFFWGDHARAHGYLLALPSGQAGAEWWSPVGVRHVLDIVRTVKRVYNVDDDRVFATGFSDGGSGSFYMALTNPTPFAGFIPLNGHLAVTQAKGLQVHLANLRNRPLYVVNTEKDSLYPAASVGPIVEAMAPLGIDVLWHSIPDFTHNPMYMATERPVIAAWMNATVRKPRPPRVTWQGTADAAGRVDWLEVTAVSSEGADGAFPDPNPTLPAGRVRIGVNVDQAFEGPGVKVSGITDDSPASAMGVVAGDVIVGLDDAEIQGMRELRHGARREELRRRLRPAPPPGRRGGGTRGLIPRGSSPRGVRAREALGRDPGRRGR